MAKNKLKNVSTKDLTNRQSGKANQIAQLEKEKKQADTKAEKKAIQKQIDKKQENLTKISKAIDKKTNQTAPEQTRSQQEYQQKINDFYASNRFQNLSPEQQQVVKQAVDNFYVDPTTLQLTKKQKQQAATDALNAAMKQFKGDRKKLRLDHEEALRADIGTLEQAIEYQKSIGGDAALIATRQLTDALEEAKSRYEIVAERKNQYLQTQLDDIQKKLDTAVGRANEDEIIQLRQLQRNYTTNLRDVQNNMAQRGLAFSGIRAQAEEDLSQNYNDTVTTAQLVAQRQREDAQRESEINTRDINTVTQQELQDLLYSYGVDQRNAIQGAEAILGTEKTQGLVGDQYSIGGQNPNQYIIGGLKGAIDQNKQGINNQLFAFEQKYGTDAFNKQFGTTYPDYTPIGGLKGTETIGYNRAKKQLKQDKLYNKITGTQLNKNKYLVGKL